MNPRRAKGDDAGDNAGDAAGDNGGDAAAAVTDEVWSPSGSAMRLSESDSTGSGDGTGVLES